jgi:hypothetical protein
MEWWKSEGVSYLGSTEDEYRSEGKMKRQPIHPTNNL